MKRDDAYSLAECIKVMVDRQLNLQLNTPKHPAGRRATMMRQNKRALAKALNEAWRRA